MGRRKRWIHFCEAIKNIQVKCIVLVFLVCFAAPSFGQQKSFTINGILFITTKHSEKNDYQSKDYYINIIKIIKGKKIFFAKHYTHQYAVDCNNEFKNIGTVEIKKDSLILKTHYTQKGHDPIPEWEQKIYKVNRNGEIVLLSNNSFQNGKWSKTEK